jgi:cell division protein FtsL
MNPIDVEYAIKKDVRNNPIVREADRRQGHEFIKTAGVWVLILSMGLFAAWQHFEVIRHGFEIEKLMKEKIDEEAINRRLKLQIETLKSPERIERIATNELHMIVPPTASTLVLERVAPTSADKAIVASAALALGPRR